jgi:orotidine-5'-phosphate decarboxylase
MKPDNPIILALDTSSLTVAKDILNQVRSNIGMVKIGLELFTAHGKEALELSSEFNIPVFLDLKLHDVPTTVEKTTAIVCEMLSKHPGNHFLSIHCFGGREMCASAFKVADGSNVSITGITVLTSITRDDLSWAGFRDTRANIKTVDFARIGIDCANPASNYWSNNAVKIGLTSFVCAPAQTALMRKHYGDDITIINPGIRPTSDVSKDHANSKPPGFALKNGATWIVVGRPITQATDPASAAAGFKIEADRNR